MFGTQSLNLLLFYLKNLLESGLPFISDYTELDFKRSYSISQFLHEHQMDNVGILFFLSEL